jgi:hypothetical protein
LSPFAIQVTGENIPPKTESYRQGDGCVSCPIHSTNKAIAAGELRNWPRIIPIVGFNDSRGRTNDGKKAGILFISFKKKSYGN